MRRIAAVTIIALAVLIGGWMWTIRDGSSPRTSGEATSLASKEGTSSSVRSTDDRETVLFWHFWGGDERAVVERIIARFNAAQGRYRVRGIAMPGNNLDVKLFLSVVGGAPPDLVNQDDPVLADWALRGAIVPLDEVASEAEINRLATWLFPAARTLGSFRGRMYGLCNGLDIRAMFVNRSMLREKGLEVPDSIEALDALGESFPMGASQGVAESGPIAFLPNPRTFWSWGIVFGGRFADPRSGRLTLDNPKLAQALAWMASYGQRYGTRALAQQSRDQALPGKMFPLLAGYYVAIVDGQWRCRDVEQRRIERQKKGIPADEIVVTSLPPPTGAGFAGESDAGWVNGNFFLIPRGSRNPRGAWEFMKFWSGFDGFAGEAAACCAEGGWIPVSAEVVEHPRYREYLEQTPLMATFARLAASPRQIPRPNIPGAARLDREVRALAEQVMLRGKPEQARPLLLDAQRRLAPATVGENEGAP